MARPVWRRRWVWVRNPGDRVCAVRVTGCWAPCQPALSYDGVVGCKQKATALAPRSALTRERRKECRKKRRGMFAWCIFVPSLRAESRLSTAVDASVRPHAAEAARSPSRASPDRADVPDRPHADSRHASITAPPLRWPEHHTIIGGEMTQHTHTHTHTTHARTAGVPFSSPQLSSRAGRGCACAAPTARRADDHLGHCPGRSLGARARRARALPRAARLLPEGAWSATCGRPSAPPWGRGSGTSSRRRPT